MRANLAAITGSRNSSLFQKFSENVQIGHNADATFSTKAPHLSDVEIPDIPGAEDISLSVRSRVQDGIGSGIGQHQRPDDHRSTMWATSAKSPVKRATSRAAI
jgi:hypothetical protein